MDKKDEGAWEKRNVVPPYTNYTGRKQKNCIDIVYRVPQCRIFLIC